MLDTVRSMLRRALLAVVLVIASAPGAAAQVWNEVGDAGDLIATAQTTLGSGPLTTILGTLGSAGDVDVYCVQVGSTPRVPGLPVVRLQCVVVAGPQLYVFDATGAGIATNSICQFGFKTVTTDYLSGPGTYYVAVAYDGVRPHSTGGAMWATGVLPERAPDGPGAASPLATWTGTGVVAPLNPYQLTLDYSGFCAAATPVTKTTWGSLKVRY